MIERAMAPAAVSTPQKHSQTQRPKLAHLCRRPRPRLPLLGVVVGHGAADERDEQEADDDQDARRGVGRLGPVMRIWCALREEQQRRRRCLGGVRASTVQE